jgi:hypothetical protein
MNDGIEMFMSLFGGRTDAYGTWAGGCEHSSVSYETFARHLYGEELIGIYPLNDGNSVKWGCSDIDIDDIDMAMNLQTAFAVKGLKTFIEKTRKGYHVWMFANDWIPASTMRRAFLVAHDVIGVPPKEVNPKQEVASGLGNYVRLPYPNGMNEVPEIRYVMFPDGTAMTLQEFLKEAMDSRVSIKDLEPLAEKHKQRSRAVLTPTPTSTSVYQALDKANGYIASIWRNGPLPNSDRSNTLMRMCHYMREFGVPINEAFIILVDADKRWGKFHERPDAVLHLTKMIEEAFGKDYEFKEDFNP